MADGNANDIIVETDINQSETSHDRWPRVFGETGRVLFKQDGKIVNSAVEFPSEWRPVDREIVSAVLVPPKSEEAQRVLKLFYNRPNDDWRYRMVVMRVFRIENPALWARYYSKREKMKTANNGHLKETMLFHGTSHENVNSICRRGFECGQRTKGIFFSPDTRMSHAFTSCANKLLRPRVVRLNTIFSALSATFYDLGHTLPQSPHAPEAQHSTVDNADHALGNMPQRNTRHSNSLRAMEEGDDLSGTPAQPDQHETTALNQNTEKPRVLQLAGRATSPGIEAVVPIPEMDEDEDVKPYPVVGTRRLPFCCVHYTFASSVLLGNTTPSHLYDRTQHDSRYDRRPQFLEFIIRDNFQAYPEYLIEYSENLIQRAKPCHCCMTILFAFLFCVVSIVLLYVCFRGTDNDKCHHS